jgi:hypothetical protein
MTQFLLVRGDDLLHIGLEFVGFRLDQVAGTGVSRPRLVASDGALITLTFPPQALCEHPPLISNPSMTAIRAGTSQVQFAVPPGTAFELTAKGILAALQGPDVRVLESELGAKETPTAIEIPWKLIVSPTARLSGGTVVSRHAIMPATSAGGVTALWRARLQSSGATITDANLALVPLRSIPGDPVPGNPDFDPPLTEAVRNLIVDQASKLPLALPNARRFELSTIGGSLSVAAKWPTLEWSQDIILGREDKMRATLSGVLYPFGHRAVLTVVTARQFLVPQPSSPSPPHHPPGPPGPPHPPHPPQNGNGNGNGDPPPPPRPPSPQMAIAGLSTIATLTIVEPARTFGHDTALGRQFPFDEVEILGRTFDVQKGDGQFFIIFPPPPADVPLLFRVRARGRNGDVVMRVPMLFVEHAAAGDPGPLRAEWNTISQKIDGASDDVDGVAIPLPGVAINMFPGSARANDPRDLHEVQTLVIDVGDEAGAFRPKISGFRAELPTLRALLAQPSMGALLLYTQEYIDQGDAADLALAVFDPNGVVIDFTKRPDRSGGLIAPKYAAHAISRTLGPVPGTVSLRDALNGATLLGLPLTQMVELNGLAPPTIIPLAGNPPGASMTWTLPLTPLGPFRPAPGSTATLNVTIASAPPGAAGTRAGQTICAVKNFDFVLPPDQPLVRLHFDAVTFTQLPGRHPDLAIGHPTVEFQGALQLLDDLIHEVKQFIGANAPAIRALPSGISAAYAFAIPNIKSGDFVLNNVAANLAVDVPFTAGTVALSVSFASRDNPFNLSILALGGGGYIDVEFGGNQLSRFEASMDFGATLAIDFLVVSAEVHALGGVHFVNTDNTITIDAFLRIGGSVNLFGLVSVSIEMVILLGYHGDQNALVGRAKIVVSVGIAFIHESVTLDSGDWTLSGPAPGAALFAAHAVSADTGSSLAGLIQYFKAFAP